MMVPSPRSSMPGRTDLIRTSWATTFASSLVTTKSMSRSRKRSMLPGPVWTALLTSTSTRPHSLEDALGGSQERGPIEQVGANGEGAAAGRFDLARRGLEAAGNGLGAGGAGLVEGLTFSHGPRRDGDVQTGVREGDRRCLADAAAGSGHERDAAVRGHEGRQYPARDEATGLDDHLGADRSRVAGSCSGE